MEFSRRDFLKALGVQGTLSMVGGRVRADGPQTYPIQIAVLQAESFDGQARFSVMYQWDRDVEYRVVGAGEEKRANRRARRPVRDDVCMDLVHFTGLPTEIDLTLEILEDGTVIDRRTFRSLDRARKSLRIAIVSCMKDHLHDFSMWNALQSQNADLFLFIGDNVYADNNSSREDADNQPVTPEQMALRFSQSRAILSVFAWRRLVPIHATWDDHDFGGNGSNRSFAFASEAAQNFSMFFGRDRDGSLCSHGPGIAQAFVAGGVLIALMDDRSFRAPKKSEETYAHWGQGQEDWLIGLLSEHAGPALIINGSQFFPTLRRDEGFKKNHPRNFESFLARVRKTPARAMFASGDIHFSEISAIGDEVLGYPTWEFTSSAMHSLSFFMTDTLCPNPLRVASTAKRNFMTLDLERRGDRGLRGRAQCWTKGPRLVFEHDFGWKN